MYRDSDTSIGGPSGRFPATRPSVIADAAHGDEERRRRASDALAAAYWKPIYRYIRIQWRKSNEDAKDLTQAFLADLLTGGTLARFDPARASFRTYLRVCVDGFVGHADEAAARTKRGGTHAIESLDSGEAAAHEVATASGASPDELFDREWRREMFALGIDDLKRLAAERGKELAFRVFEAHDLEDAPPSYADLASRFGLSLNTVTNHLAWARRELRRIIVDRVEALTATPAECARDVRSLFGKRR